MSVPKGITVALAPSNVSFITRPPSSYEILPAPVPSPNSAEFIIESSSLNIFPPDKNASNSTKLCSGVIATS